MTAATPTAAATRNACRKTTCKRFTLPSGPLWSMWSMSSTIGRFRLERCRVPEKLAAYLVVRIARKRQDRFVVLRHPVVAKLIAVGNTEHLRVGPRECHRQQRSVFEQTIALQQM